MSFGKRFKQAREAAGLSQAAVAERMPRSVTSQTVGNWERDVFEPSHSDTIDLAHLLNVDLTWLMTGNYPPTVTGVTDGSEAAYRGRIVPSVDWSSIDKFIARQYVPDMSVRSQFPCGPRSFHTVLGDRSMEPEIKQGEGLVVDPDASPAPGSYVLVRIGKDLLVRKFRPRENHVELAAINPDWASSTVPKLTPEVLIGVVREIARQVY